MMAQLPGKLNEFPDAPLFTGSLDLSETNRHMQWLVAQAALPVLGRCACRCDSGK
jgi:hypothetical protein